VKSEDVDVHGDEDAQVQIAPAGVVHEDAHAHAHDQ